MPKGVVPATTMWSPPGRSWLSATLDVATLGSGNSPGYYVEGMDAGWAVLVRGGMDRLKRRRHVVVPCSIAASSRNTPEDGLSSGNNVPLLAWLLLRSRACSAAVFRSGI